MNIPSYYFFFGRWIKFNIVLWGNQMIVVVCCCLLLMMMMIIIIISFDVSVHYFYLTHLFLQAIVSPCRSHTYVIKIYIKHILTLETSEWWCKVNT